jgi:hypothetical protein
MATMKIGFLSLPVMGHLNPMSALARKLQSRGNEVVFIGVPDAEPVARAADLQFVRPELQPGRSRTDPIESNRCSDRSTNRTAEAGGALHNPCGVKYHSGGVGPGRADGGDANRI